MILLARFHDSIDIMPLVNKLWNENIFNNVVAGEIDFNQPEIKTEINLENAVFYDEQKSQNPSDFLNIFIYNLDDLQVAKTILDTFICEIESGIKPKNSYSLVASLGFYLKEQFSKTPLSLGFMAIALILTTLFYFNSKFVLQHFAFDYINFLQLDFFNTTFNVQTTWQIWRYFTPTFIHTDFYLLIFANFWFFIIALNLEKALKTRFIWLLFLSIFCFNFINYAFFKNILAGFYPLFHSLLTFAFVQNNFIYKKPIYLVPNFLFYFIVFFLILGLLNISNFFGTQAFAFINATGALVGGILASFKFLRKKDLKQIEKELDQYN